MSLMLATRVKGALVTGVIAMVMALFAGFRMSVSVPGMVMVVYFPLLFKVVIVVGFIVLVFIMLVMVVAFVLVFNVLIIVLMRMFIGLRFIMGRIMVFVIVVRF